MLLSGFAADVDVWMTWNDILKEGLFTIEENNAYTPEWTNWGENQPNGGRDENCVVADGSTFTWRDDPCDAKHLPLCNVLPAAYNFNY